MARIWTLSEQNKLCDTGAHFRADGVCTNMPDKQLADLLNQEGAFLASSFEARAKEWHEIEDQYWREFQKYQEEKNVSSHHD